MKEKLYQVVLVKQKFPIVFATNIKKVKEYIRRDKDFQEQLKEGYQVESIKRFDRY